MKLQRKRRWKSLKQWEVRVVVFGAGHGHLAAKFLFKVRLAGLHFLRRLPQVGQDKLLGAAHAHQNYDRKFIAGDGGHIQLAVITYLVDKGADLVVLLYRFEQGLVRGVHPEAGLQLIQHMGPQLLPVVLIAVLIVLEGHVYEAAEEIVIVDDAHILHEMTVIRNVCIISDEPAVDRYRMQ